VNVRQSDRSVKAILLTDSYFSRTEIDRNLRDHGPAIRISEATGHLGFATVGGIVLRRCSLSPVNRYPGTGHDSNGRYGLMHAERVGELLAGEIGATADLFGFEVGLQSAGESEQHPNTTL